MRLWAPLQKLRDAKVQSCDLGLLGRIEDEVEHIPVFRKVVLIHGAGDGNDAALSGRSTEVVAKELGIGALSFYNWGRERAIMY